MSDAGPTTWDLGDPTAGRIAAVPAPRRIDPRAVIAATAGVVALAVAVPVELGVLVRWPVGLGLALVTLLLGLPALGRVRRLSGLLLPAIGLLAAVAAVLALAERPTEAVPPGAVTVALPQTAAASASPLTAQTGGGDHLALGSSLAGLLDQIHLVHGADGPYPGGLDLLAGGRVVVTSGFDRGDVIGVLPLGMRIRYAVTPDRRYFRITLTDAQDASMTVTADSTAVGPPG